jgi:hypothetical protein
MRKTLVKNDDVAVESEPKPTALEQASYVSYALPQHKTAHTACSHAHNPPYMLFAGVDLTFLEDYSVGQPEERIPPLGHGEGRSDEQYEEALLDT